MSSSVIHRGKRPALKSTAFGARFVPGLRGLNQRERDARIRELRDSRPDLVRELDVEVETTRAVRNALSRGPFPGMGTGDPDLYKAFMWRFWFLVVEEGGRIGVVSASQYLDIARSQGVQEVRFPRTYRSRLDSAYEHEGLGFS